MRSSLLSRLLVAVALLPLVSASLPDASAAVPNASPAGRPAALSNTSVRPIAPWEKAAVELALAYSTHGADAWWDALAEESAWKRAFRHAPPEKRAAIRTDIIDQIRARVGPAEGTRWELQTLLGQPSSDIPPQRRETAFRLHFPSGSDSLLLLELLAVADGGGESVWRLAGVRTWGENRADPEPGVAAARDLAGRGASSAPAAGSRRARSDLLATAPLVRGAFGLLVAAALGGLVLHWRRGREPRRRRAGSVNVRERAGRAYEKRRPSGGARARWATIFLAVVALVLGGFEIARGLRATSSPSGQASSREAASPGLPARQLAAWRNDLASGTPAGQGAALPAGAPEMAELWRIQGLLHSGDLNGAEAALERLDQRPAPPLRSILRGRLAFLRGDEVSTTLAYEQALAELPPFDGLLLESAETLLAAGDEKRARRQLTLIAEGGGRIAAAYYLLARFAAIEGEDEAAARWLQTAWGLEPSERADLLGERVYAHVLRTGDLFEAFALGQPREPPVEAPDLARDPILLPAGWIAAPTGGSLTLFAGDTAIAIPGGSALAPPGTAPVDAITLREWEDERLLSRLGDLRAAGTLSGALAQPALRTTLSQTAMALARQHRWADVVTLTEPLAAHPERLPGKLGRLRAEALRRTGHVDRATALLVELAKNNVENRRRDPEALFHLTELLVEVNRHDLALRVARAAESQSSRPPSISLLPRIQMEKRLAESFSAYRSRRFVVRYPANLGPYGPQLISEVLEAEVDRIQRWIPHQPRRPIEVHLFPFREFVRLYSQGGEVLGVFDGKVRVPLAEMPALSPFVVAILTHEVAHALIADATSGKAPAWLHEGLAQHVQMLQNRSNPIPDYRRAGRLLAFPLLDPVLRSHSDPELTAVAYDQAAWVVHYLEARYGVAGLHRLLRSYGRDLGSGDDALAAALGTSPAALDVDFRTWIMSEAPSVWPPPPLVRYDLGERP